MLEIEHRGVKAIKNVLRDTPAMQRLTTFFTTVRFFNQWQIGLSG
jgi:hypothetical protein